MPNQGTCARRYAILDQHGQPERRRGAGDEDLPRALVRYSPKLATVPFAHLFRPSTEPTAAKDASTTTRRIAGLETHTISDMKSYLDS